MSRSTSLFAAFAVPDEAEDEEQDLIVALEATEEPDWTTASSFQQASVDDDENSRQKRKRKEKSRREEKKRRKRERKKTQDDDVSAATSAQKASSHVLSRHEPEAESSPDWRLDTRRDKENLSFGRMYAGEVPLFRRSGRGTVVGLPSTLRLVFDDGRGGASGGDNRQVKSSRYWALKQYKRITSARFKVIEAPEAIEPTKRRSRWDAVPGTEHGVQLFLPFEDEATSEESGAKMTIDEGEMQSTLIMKRTKDFNEQLRERPTDVDLWREFAAFQEQVLEAEGGKSHKARALLTEKQMAIYEKALAKNPGNEDLIQEYMQLCERVLSPEELEHKWDTMMFRHPSSISLWQSYLHYSTSQLSRFRVPHCSAKYHKCMETLANIKAGKFASHVLDPKVAEAALLSVVVQESYFLKQAGFRERGRAALQALAEFNLFLPDELVDAARKGQHLPFFETFWDSYAPRLGDEGAGGFRKWMEIRRQGGIQGKLQGTEHEPAYPEKATDLTAWQHWLAVEEFREQCHWQPWRPLDGETEDDCEDPDRLAIYDDISNSLFYMDSMDRKAELVLRLVEYAGADFPARFCTNHAYAVESFQRLEGCGYLFRPLVAYLRHDIVTRYPANLQAELLFTPADTSAQIQGRAVIGGMILGNNSDVWGDLNLQPDAEPSSFSRLRELISFGRRSWTPRPLPQASQAKFIRNVFDQATAVPGLDTNFDLLRSRIEFEAAHGLKAARKLTKSLLKAPQHRNNLRLYDLYAQLELRNGKLVDAFKVYDTAISLGTQMDPAEKQYSVCLCVNYALALLEQGNAELGRHVMASFVLDKFEPCAGRLGIQSKDGRSASNALSATTIMRALRQAELWKEDWTSRSRLSGRVPQQVVRDRAVCLAWLTMLTSGLSAAMSVFEQVLDWIESSSDNTNKGFPPHVVPDDITDKGSIHNTLEHEQLYHHWVYMLLWQSERDRVAPATVRSVLLRALGTFPNDPELLSVFIGMEARFRIAGRVRDWMSTALQDDTCAAVWLFAVAAEILQPTSGSPYKVRYLLEKAVSSPKARQCVLLWRMHMELERAQTGLAGLQRANDIFYRAIEARPGCKSLYLHAVRHNPRNLQEILDIMQEKELHLRTPIEEIEMLQQELEQVAQEKRLEQLRMAQRLQHQEDTEDLIGPAAEDASAPVMSSKSHTISSAPPGASMQDGSSGEEETGPLDNRSEASESDETSEAELLDFEDYE